MKEDEEEAENQSGTNSGTNGRTGGRPFQLVVFDEKVTEEDPRERIIHSNLILNYRVEFHPGRNIKCNKI